MRRFKSFGTPILSSDEPVEFEVNGHTFRCRKALQGRTLLEFIGNAGGDNFTKSATAVLDFIDSCVVADDRERFRELTGSENEDEENVVGLETITQISTWLVETYSSGNSSDSEGKEQQLVELESNPSLNGQPTTTSMSEAEPSPMV